MKKIFQRFFIIIVVVAMLITVYANRLTSADLAVTDTEPPSREDYSTVSITQSTKKNSSKLNYKDIKKLAQSAINKAGGFADRIQDNTVVVIKPNLVYDYTYYRNEKLNPNANGCTTDYRLVKAVVEMVRKYNPNGKVYVIEGSAYDTDEMYKSLGYTKKNIPQVDEFYALEKISGDFKDNKSEKLVKLKLADNLYTQNGSDEYEDKIYYMNKLYYEADFLINMPVVKTHWAAAVSGAVKNHSIGGTPANLYGSESGTNRGTYIDHNDLNRLQQWIHDYYACRPSDFVVMDGLNACQNGPSPRSGPMSRNGMNMRVVLAGSDGVAVDTVESLVMSWNPYTVQHLKTLGAAGYGNISPDKIRITGKTVASVRKYFMSEYPDNNSVKSSQEAEVYSDKKAPALTLKSVKYKKKKINFKLKVGADVKKVEVQVDGKYVTAPLSGGKSTYKVSAKLKKGKRKVKVSVFDNFHNVSSAVKTIKV